MKGLFLKISIVTITILALMGFLQFTLTYQVGEDYLQTKRQNEYINIAQDIAKGIQPVIKKTINEDSVKPIIDLVSSINPELDIYLLKPTGEIFKNISKEKNLQSQSVNLEQLQSFIASKNVSNLRGENPKNKEKETPFSTAEIRNIDKDLVGYVYVVLNSGKRELMSSNLKNSYLGPMSYQSIIGGLFSVLILGLFSVWYMVNHLKNYSDTVTAFKNGNMNVRVSAAAKNDLPILGNTFNEMADEIESNIERIKNSEALRKELIANVSHDLRTPLLVIQGYIETLILKKDSISEIDRNKYLNIVLNGTDKLSKLINQLFEYSKLEANQITPVMEPFQFSDLIKDAFESFQIIAKEKDITVKMPVNENLPLVSADVALMERVLQNLMDNAIKFTPPKGQVTIALKDLNETVEIKVQNSGAVISKEKLPYIFDRFKKSSKMFSKKNNGAGLGLAIVKKIVELHNSNIKVTSEEAEGTTFFFEIPKSQQN